MLNRTLIKYVPKLSAAIIHLLLFLLVTFLFLGRKITSLRPDFILGAWPDFYLHVSNFSISYILVSGIGFAWILLGVRRLFIWCLGICVALINLIYELWIPILNTPDTIDAYYGLCGTALALVFVLIIQKYGMQRAPVDDIR